MFILKQLQTFTLQTNSFACSFLNCKSTKSCPGLNILKGFSSGISMNDFASFKMPAFTTVIARILCH